MRGYARWFGVDLLCAIVELRMLGVAVEAEYEQQIRRTMEPFKPSASSSLPPSAPTSLRSGGGGRDGRDTHADR